MDQTLTPKEQVIEALIQLTARLTEEDLGDPEIFGLVSQLVQILAPGADPLPESDVDILGRIKDKAELFAQAVKMYGITNPERMDQLVQSLKATGLFA